MTDREKNKLDAAIDAALAKYATVEPRPGLEDRILANLRAQSTAPHPALWRWALAGTLTGIAVMVTVLVWRPDRSEHPLLANHPTTIEQIHRSPNPPITT